MIVVDASVVVQMLFADEAGVMLSERLSVNAGTIATPHLLDVEVASALRAIVRSRDMTASAALSALDDLADLRIERYSHEPLMGRIWELRDALSASDAAYVALAESLGAELWTRDARLARSRGPRCRIAVM
jgi:predicted nucleic acid-binding protein